MIIHDFSELHTIGVAKGDYLQVSCDGMLTIYNTKYAQNSKSFSKLIV